MFLSRSAMPRRSAPKLRLWCKCFTPGKGLGTFAARGRKADQTWSSPALTSTSSSLCIFLWQSEQDLSFVQVEKLQQELKDGARFQVSRAISLS